MKLSQNFKQKILKRILTILTSVVIVLITTAVFKPMNNNTSVTQNIEELQVNENLKSEESSATYATTSVSIADDGAIVCDSIMQGVKDANLADGNYIFRVNGLIDGTVETKDYAVELINYYDDVTYSLADGETETTVALGDDTTDYKMLVVKYHKNLTINAGVTLTATNVSDLTYKKGMYLCVMGELENNGTISMTARGTYNQVGENVYIWKKLDGNYEYIPAVGGAGGATVKATYKQSIAGKKGTDGTNRQTGGGGSGSAACGDNSPISYSGTGAAGTSYSGGSGGGGCNTNSNGSSIYAGNGQPNGGAGGLGRGYRSNSSWYTRRAGGGAGNPGGNGGQNGLGNDVAGKGENGTGGLLLIYTDNLTNNSIISSNGSKGTTYAEATGGSSGAGSINIIANNITTTGEVVAISEANSNGGAGGNGCVTINDLSDMELRFIDGFIKLEENETYQVNSTDLIYACTSENFVEGIALGELKYEIADTNIAVVDNAGRITGKAPGETTIKVTDVTYNKTIEIRILVAIKMESIVQGFRDENLPDGNYTIIAGDEVYEIELINYYDDVTYSLTEGETEKEISLGDTSTEYRTLVVKYHKNLKIDKGVKVTATSVDNLTYKKGMFICVLGDLENYGTISMTARGTYNCEGENVYLWKNTDSSFEYVPAEGGIGGESIKYSWTSSSSTYTKAGNAGANGNLRQTGGGGSGALMANREDYSSGTRITGAGTAGTSYSGGTGGGGIDTNYGGTYSAGNGGINGGAGGTAYSYRAKSSWAVRCAGGGAGNIGGPGKYTASGATLGANNANYYGQNGTGGLLILYADTLYNKGNITSEGSKGGAGNAGGGASGGGSINIFANVINEVSTVSAAGGISTGTAKSGAGGEGSVTINKVKPDLVYPKKELVINNSESYQINKNSLYYINQNELQTGYITLGNVQFESMDNSVVTVDSTGKIKTVAEGNTKVKITDTTNNISTYIYVEVVNNVKIDVQNGKNFTIALKQNGTVWSYGLNDNGQLGTGDNENKTEPTQITDLSNVKQIATGYSHSLALLSNGTVYSWGLGTNGQLGNGTESNSTQPVKVDGISNIVKIDAYKNKSIALDSTGKVYIWGETHSNLPMRVVFSEKIVDISGNLILTEKGYVYNISDLTQPISGLSNIAKISSGEAHNLALSTYGIAYVWGKNTYGECGISTVEEVTADGIGTNILDISAGNCISILHDQDRKVYVLGNNGNGQIGLDTTAKATSITQLNLEKNIQSISAGEGTHSSLIDEDGFVWNTGLNTYGELGTGDLTAKTTYSQIGKTILTTNFESKYLDINESTTIVAKLENTFNLKIDIVDDNQSNFTVTLSDNENLALNNKTVTGLDYCTANATITHNTKQISKDVKIIVAMKVDSIVQGFRDLNLDDGEYTVVVKEQPYTVELINYYDDVVYSEDTELGDDSTDYKTLVVKYHGNLTIDSGVTLTAKSVDNLTYKKGMYICVLGNIYNNGTITMTAKGTYNHEGENVYLWKNIDDTYEYVPADGGTGGEKTTRRSNGGALNIPGMQGESGANRQTGGGGSGALSLGDTAYKFYATSGAGSAGTSYSGGSGRRRT